MKKIKKISIIAGGTVGGTIGGTLSLVGKLSKSKLLDSLGESIIDSALYTGEIAGNFISGTADVAVGSVKKDEKKLESGRQDLKLGTKKIIDNYIESFKLIGGSGAEIANGVLRRDKVTIIKGGKRLFKILAIGALTVGAIKIDEDEE